jgi:hypothetical protein
MARHNAIEGCVFEAWSALVCAHRAKFGEESLRPTYSRVARDEIGHAQLSWDIHRWFLSQLSDEEREILANEQRRAITSLPKMAVSDATSRGLHGGEFERLSLAFARGLDEVCSLAG